jgi:hypothetical protein
MTKQQRKLDRTIAVETSLLLARLCEDYGLELGDAVQGVEAALHRSFWGELPEGYQGAILPVPGQPGYSATPAPIPANEVD